MGLSDVFKSPILWPEVMALLNRFGVTNVRDTLTVQFTISNDGIPRLEHKFILNNDIVTKKYLATESQVWDVTEIGQR